MCFLGLYFVHHRVFHFLMPYYYLMYQLLDDLMTSANGKV